MCKSPSVVHVERGPGYEAIEVPCKVCPACRYARVTDYVGRCLAEAAYSTAVCAIRLTYRPGADALADQLIYPAHFQRFIRALRRRGHSIN